MVSARNKNPVNQLRRLNKEQEVDLEKGPILAALEQAREEQSEEKWGKERIEGEGAGILPRQALLVLMERGVSPQEAGLSVTNGSSRSYRVTQSMHESTKPSLKIKLPLKMNFR